MTWHKLTDKEPPLNKKLIVLAHLDSRENGRMVVYRDTYVGKGPKFKSGSVSWTVVWWCLPPKGVKWEIDDI